MKTLKLSALGALFLGLATSSAFAYSNGQLRKIGREAGKKAVSGVALVPVTVDPNTVDFPTGGIQSLTPAQVEIYRSGFTEGQQRVLRGHRGWKWALATATPATPALGYTKPAYGEILKNSVIVGDNVDVDPNYAVLPASEADLLFVVKSGDINEALTPRDILENVRGVYPAVELAAAYVPTLPDLYGPALGGDGVLPAVNAAARLFVRGPDMIKIPGTTRSMEDWITILNGGLIVSDLLEKGSGNLSANAAAVPHLNNFLNLIQALKAQGIKLRRGDIVSPGTAVAVRFLTDGRQQRFRATYGNLDPDQVVQIQVNFVPGGLTQRAEFDDRDEKECEEGEDDDQ